MPGKQALRDLDRAAEAMLGVLDEAVRDTVAESDPDVARDVVDELLELGEEHPDPDGNNAAVALLTILLAHRLDGVRSALFGEADRVDPVVLGWIEEHLGRRCRLRAGYTAAALRDDADFEEAGQHAGALGPDFLPSLIWLLAGAGGCYGDAFPDPSPSLLR